ncbi:glycoside hydrolase family 2 protein [Microbacterium abyssi]|uniref:glycoside hydrolase family 2 protein n=1 Tax=Microbacterium abyssi TaxID=2782166 RepID=UPI001E3195D5|nr:glycoside hydrolase family 2 TIM barrel-domain containing protein [Microbacterium sp. A18JL241]
MTALLTEWGEALDPDAVLPEYPRPQMVRDSHLSLNGRWDYAIVPSSSWPGNAPEAWDGEIIVPFSPETPLSGVERQLQPSETLWYRRTVVMAPGFRSDRLVLHFGAVDQSCVVFVDGVEVASHVGGFTAFSAVISPERDEFELVVAVQDLTDTSHHSRGKQRVKRGGIWYSPQSGIWQTVWLESMPEVAVQHIELTPRLRFDDTGSVVEAALEVTVRAWDDVAAEASVVISAGGVAVAQTTMTTGVTTRVDVPDARLWSPEDPYLYDLSIALAHDRITSYAGLRSLGVGKDAAGHPRLLLNGAPYFAAGLLDQGYWSDGWLTAPSDAAFVRDIELARSLGFTMLRKHIKLEPLRWYHHCDRLGMLVWQDMVNGGETYRPRVITAPVLTPVRLRDDRHRLFGRADAAGRAQFLRELDETIAQLRNQPSIVCWVPFNEGWGQFDAAAVADRVRGLDDSRVIDHASGWHDQGGGDVRSLHVYFRRLRMRAAWSDGRRPIVLSEYGGYSLRVDGHVSTDKRFGYRRFGDPAALTAAFAALHRDEILPALPQGLSATVYTQLSDVEDEDNGLITYDRRVVKIDEEAVRAQIGALRLETNRSIDDRA